MSPKRLNSNQKNISHAASLNLKDFYSPQSSIFPQINKKILIQREHSRKKIRKILEKCAICQKSLEFT
jgi:hypothetical protein